jgi:hypothetical protein
MSTFAQRSERRRNMVLGVKTRLMLAVAVAAAALLALTTADAQMDPTSGSPTTPGIPQTTPGTTPTTPQPLPSFGEDAGMGGSGFTPPASVPAPFGGDQGPGGSGFSPPSTLGGRDGGFGY